MIEAPENSPANRYVRRMTVDGHAAEKPFLGWSELKEGATVRFDMTDSQTDE